MKTVIVVMKQFNAPAKPGEAAVGNPVAIFSTRKEAEKFRSSPKSGKGHCYLHLEIPFFDQ